MFLGFLSPFVAGRSSETFAPPKVSNTSKGGLREGGSWSPPSLKNPTPLAFPSLLPSAKCLGSLAFSALSARCLETNSFLSSIQEIKTRGSEREGGGDGGFLRGAYWGEGGRNTSLPPPPLKPLWGFGESLAGQRPPSTSYKWS